MSSRLLDDLKSMNLDEMSDLGDKIADFLASKTSYDIDSVIKSINVMEITMALHYVFNGNKDRFIFDDAASIMVHKVLTGRESELQLRNSQPLKLNPNNPYDAYEGGEVGEGLGVALSYALNTDNHVICIMDDYALNYGVTYETLVQISKEKPNLTIVLVDEQQSLLRHYNSLDSIIKSVRISKTYTGIKKDMRMMLDSNPFSRPLFNTLVKMRDAVKETVLEPTIFKQFGMDYQGPIDGQSLADLIRVLELAKGLKGPNVIHVQTRLRKRSKRNINFPAFKTDTSVPSDYKTYHELFDDVLVGQRNEKLMLLVDTISFGDYFAKFENTYPDNYKITTGSPEALVTMASGYAKMGYRVVLALASSDLLDALNPLRNQFINTQTPITILLRNSGLINTQNPVNQGIYDVDGLVKSMNIYNPRSLKEASDLLDYCLSYEGQHIIRYQNHSEKPVYHEVDLKREWEVVRPFDESSLGVVFTSGAATSSLLDRIQSNGLNIGLVHCRNISTFDVEILENVHTLSKKIIVYNIESKTDTISQSIYQFIAKNNKYIDVESLNLENVNVNRGSGDIKREYKLTIDDVLKRFLEQ